ncbi:MAG: NAD(P)/FAD-dependent oxidoreductase [Mycobacteriales bacterium]
MTGGQRPVAEVAVVGGGAIGCAAALFLLRERPDLDVVVFEPDPTYRDAATPRASGGVRQLFTRPENILLSRYTLDFLRDWPDVGWTPRGYLFIAGPDGAGTLRANLDVQRAHGVRAEWLDPAALAARYPDLATADLGGAVLSPDDGWLDPSALLGTLRRAAAGLGARFVRDRVTRLDVTGTRVTRLELASGGALRPDAVVNAAGLGAAQLARQAGMPVPVEPLCRFEHHVEYGGGGGLAGLPFLKDPAGLAIRPDGAGLSVGLVDFDRPGGADPARGREYFDTVVWPALAHRMPRLDRLRHRASSVGWYDLNRLDGNAIVGNWPGHVDNLYLACGFSGHGLMHAPGIGRALAELVVHGRYRTLDLTRLGYPRIAASSPYPELGIR